MTTEWITTTEALKLLGGISRWTFWRLRKEGILPCGVRFGKRAQRYHRPTIEAYAKKRKEEAEIYE